MPDSKLYDILGVSRNASDQEIKKVGSNIYLILFEWIEFV
jgi:curved DNA-binding protein CbpA